MVLQNSNANSEARDSPVLALKLDSEKLNLVDILDAIHDALVKKMSEVHDSNARGMPERDVIYLATVGSRRTLVNEQGQEVKEVFETPDYKVELRKEGPRVNNNGKHEKANRNSQQEVVDDYQGNCLAIIL